MLCGICHTDPDVIKLRNLQSKQIHGIIIHCVTVFHQREGIEFLKPCVELLKSLSSMKVNIVMKLYIVTCMCMYVLHTYIVLRALHNALF